LLKQIVTELIGLLCAIEELTRISQLQKDLLTRNENT
jgi:hypothetical protein